MYGASLLKRLGPESGRLPKPQREFCVPHLRFALHTCLICSLQTELPLLPRIHGRRCQSSQVRASVPSWGKIGLSISLPLSPLSSPPPSPNPSIPTNHPSQPGEGLLTGPAALSPWSIRWPGGQDRRTRHRHGSKSPNLELKRAVRGGGGKLRMASCWDPPEAVLR